MMTIEQPLKQAPKMRHGLCGKRQSAKQLLLEGKAYNDYRIYL